MTIDTVLVWGGLIIALLDSTGYGDEINHLVDRIVGGTVLSIKNREFPVTGWHRNFHTWLMAQTLLQQHENGTRRMPERFAEAPEIKKYLRSIKELRALGERRLVFRKVLNKFFMAAIKYACYAAEFALVIAVWFPFWYLLVELSMPPVEAAVATLLIGGAFNVVFFEQLFAVAHWVVIRVSSIAFSITVALLAFPLMIFRVLPTGYLSATGLLFAALGAFRYLSA